MTPDNLSEVILMAIGTPDWIHFDEFCNRLRHHGYLPTERKKWAEVFDEVRKLERLGWIVVKRAHDGAHLIEGLSLEPVAVESIRAKMDSERGLLNLREVKAEEAEVFMSPTSNVHLHACGDPDCIVPHPAPHKRRP